MKRSRTRTSVAALVGGLAVLASALVGATGPASASTATAPSGSTTVAAVAPGPATTSGWTAGGLVSGVSAPRTAAVAAPGGSGIATVGGCVFYATSSNAGGYCPSGATGHQGVPQSLQAYLHSHHALFTPCRFFPLPDGMTINHVEPPGGHFMIKACLSDVDLAQPWGGTHVGVVVYVQWVPDDKKNEWLNVPPAMQELWQQIGDGNYYPLPRIGSGPASPVRVGTYQYFWTTWVKALDSSQETEPSFDFQYHTLTQGDVTLHAELEDFVIDPGQDGLPSIDCGKAETPFDPDQRDTVPRSKGGTQPSDCWTVYQHSSASEDNEVVKLSGKATWHVEVLRGGVQLADLGLHSYTVRQRLAVGEVQPLTDW